MVETSLAFYSTTQAPKSFPPVLQTLLYRPMLLLSVGVHVLFLSLPVPEKAPSTTPPQEEEVSISMADLLTPSTPKPTPQTETSPSTTPPPQTKATTPPASSPAVISAPQPSTPIPPVSQAVITSTPSPTPEPVATPQVVTPTPIEAPPEASPVVAETPVEEPDFLAGLNLSSNSNLSAEEMALLRELPIELVRENQVAYFFEPGATPAQLKAGIFNWLRIPLKSPDQAYTEDIEPQLQQLGFTQIQRLDSPYGEADLYQAKNTQGAELYFSVVRLKLGSGTFVTLWRKDPRV